MGMRDLISHWVMHSLCAVSLQGDGCGRPIYWFCVVVSFLCRVDWCERPIKSFVLFFLFNVELMGVRDLSSRLRCSYFSM